MEREEIDLIDLLYRILLKWRLFIIFGVVGAVIGGLYGHYNASKQAAITTISYDEKVKNAEKLLSTEDIADAQTAASIYKKYKKELDLYEQYLDESILLNLDPNCVPTLVVDYYIDNHFKTEYPIISKNNNMKSIVQTYEGMIMNDEVDRQVADILGVKSSMYIDELVTFGGKLNYSDDSNFNLYLNGGGTINAYVEKDNSEKEDSEKEDSEKDILRIVIVGTDEEKCNKIYEIVNNRVYDLKESMSKAYGDFDVFEVTQKFSKVQCNEILEKKSSINDSLYVMRKNMVSYLTEFKGDKLNYYKILISNSGNEAETDRIIETVETIPNTVGVTNYLRYIIIGVLTIWFIIALSIAVKYILQNVYYTEKELKNQLVNINYLGTARYIDVKMQKQGRIDRLIRKIFYGQHTEDEERKTVNLILSYAVIAAEKAGITSLYVTGTYKSDEAFNIVEKLKTVFINTDIVFKDGNSVVKDSKSLEDMSESDAVILVEKIGASKVDDISREIEVCNQLGVRILGVIGVE